MNRLQGLGLLVLFCIATMCQAPQSRAQSHPDFQLEFDQFIPQGGGVHTDTHRIVVGKPVKTLTLSMISSGDPNFGEQHLPGTEILLDLSQAVILDSTNSDSELSASVLFVDVLPIGTYPATKVVFGYDPDYFHGTQGYAYGAFADGEPFYVSVDAGFVPEPSSAILLLGGMPLLALRRVRRS